MTIPISGMSLPVFDVSSIGAGAAVAGTAGTAGAPGARPEA